MERGGIQLQMHRVSKNVEATGAGLSEFEKFKAWVMQRDGKVEERAVGAVMNRNARTLGAS